MRVITKGSFLSLAAFVVALAPASVFAAGPASRAGSPQVGWDSLQPPAAFEAGSLRFAPGAAVDAAAGRRVAAEGDEKGLGSKPLHIKAFTQADELVSARAGGFAALAADIVAAAGKPIKELDLAGIKNKHIKTTLQYTLGGKQVWVSGGFDRDQKAFVSVLEEGKAARFFNVEEIFNKPPVLDIGNAKYKLSLSPDMTDQLESEIVLTNTANRKDRTPITLREMLGAVSAAGESVTAGGKEYKVFYYDDIKDGALNAASQSIAFIHTDANAEIHVFLVPSELVPGDKVAVFKMIDNHRIGLQNSAGKLKVFDNP